MIDPLLKNLFNPKIDMKRAIFIALILLFLYFVKNDEPLVNIENNEININSHFIDTP